MVKGKHLPARGGLKVVVTGAMGHLGAAIVEKFEATHHVTALSRSDLDIADHAAVRTVIASIRPAAIINCAAYNDVVGAECTPSLALDINALGVMALARTAADHDATLVHFSSDFVFDGTLARPLVESDPPRPLSFYGCTKLLGEFFAREAPRHFVLRVESLFGGPTEGRGARAGTLSRLLDAARRGERVRVFSDRVVSPSYVPDVARSVRHLVERGAAPGTYHAATIGAPTWEEAVRYCCTRAGIDVRLDPIPFASVVLPASRPQYCALDSTKLAAAGGEVRPWQDAADRWIAGLPSRSHA